MTKQKKHTWWVNTGLYHKQLGCRTTDMEEASRKAYEKLIKMDYEEFCEYVDLNVSGLKKY